MVRQQVVRASREVTVSQGPRIDQKYEWPKHEERKSTPKHDQMPVLASKRRSNGRVEQRFASVERWSVAIELASAKKLPVNELALEMDGAQRRTPIPTMIKILNERSLSRYKCESDYPAHSHSSDDSSTLGTSQPVREYCANDGTTDNSWVTLHTARTGTSCHR
uniref:Uncharacterized protein n=1 Tax=Panagrellus redivivus TaxID=6233 RepID=A0A7E4VCS7_PANRE